MPYLSTVRAAQDVGKKWYVRSEWVGG